MDLPIRVDRMSMELPILHFKGSQIEISKSGCFAVMKVCFYLRNSEMQHHAAFSSGSSLFAKVPGPEFIKLFPYSTQLSMKFILLINVNNCWHFSIYKHDKYSI